MMSFYTPGLEQSFALQRNVQLQPQDEAWALFNLLFGLAGLGKWAQRAEWPPLGEALSIVAWAASGPLHLFLIRRRRNWYLLHRHSFVVLMRLSRWVLFFSEVSARQDPRVGPAREMPASALAAYTHLCWQVNFLLITALGIVLPMRLFLPCQLAALLISLRGTAVRCRRECGLPLGAAAAGVAGAAAAATCGSSLEPTIAAGTCQASAGVAGVADYYMTAAVWIRSLGPSQLWRLSVWWRRQRRGAGDSCPGACFAVHSWLQACGGVLLPTLLLWVWEERLRTQEVRLAIRQQQQQQVQQQGGRQRYSGPSRLPLGAKPVPTAVALGWFAGTAWLLWLLLEALLL